MQLQVLSHDCEWLAEFVASVFTSIRDETDWHSLIVTERKHCLAVELNLERRGGYDWVADVDGGRKEEAWQSAYRSL